MQLTKENPVRIMGESSGEPETTTYIIDQ